MAQASESFAKMVDGYPKTQAAEAMAGLILMRADAAVEAKKYDKLVADMAAPWMKAEFLDVSEGTLRTFAEETIPAQLLAAAAEVGKRDKKAARKLLEHAAALVKPVELRAKVTSALWGLTSSGEWLQIPFDDSIKIAQGTMENGRINGEDPTREANTARMTMITVTTIPLAEISGIKGRVTLGTSESAGLRWLENSNAQSGISLLVTLAPRRAVHTQFFEKKSPENLATLPLGDKSEYELSIEVSDGKVRSAVDGKNVYNGAVLKKPCDGIWLVVNDGKAALLSLHLRKK